MHEEKIDYVWVGEAELTEREAGELIGIFNMPGWQVFCRILAKEQESLAINSLGNRTERTQNGWGFVQGQYTQCDEILDFERAARVGYKELCDARDNG